MHHQLFLPLRAECSTDALCILEHCQFTTTLMQNIIRMSQPTRETGNYLVSRRLGDFIRIMTSAAQGCCVGFTGDLQYFRRGNARAHV